MYEFLFIHENYKSMNTRVYSQLYKMVTFNYNYNYTRDICIIIRVLLYTLLILY